jgi:hypothetical protein
MAVLIADEDFEGAGNGANISIATAPTFNIATAGTGSLIHSTDRSISGTRSAKINATVNNRQIGYSGTSKTNYYLRFYFYLTANPPNNAFLFEIYAGDTTTLAAQFGFNTSGNARLRDGTTQIATAAITAGQWYRADWTLLGAGDQTVRLYTGANLHSAVTGNASFTMTGALTSTNFAALQFGNIATVTGGWTCYVDWLGLSDTALPVPFSGSVVVDPGGMPINRKVGGITTLHTIKRRVSGVATTFIFNRKDGGSSGGTGTVSDILVPSEGAWVGGTYNDANSTTTQATTTAFESISGNDTDIFHFYKKDASFTGVSTTERNLAIRSGKDRAMLYYTWKISTAAGAWASVASGTWDSRIDTMCAGMKQWPYKFFLCFYHEPEDDVTGNGGSNFGTTTDFKNMWQHVVTRCRAQGLDNAVFLLNYMGYLNWKIEIPAMYPGDSYVDWIAWDPYPGGGFNTLDDMLNDTTSGWAGFYNWATTARSGFNGLKPLMLGEWGLDATTASDSHWASFLNSIAASAEADFPQVKAWLYWNDWDYRLETASRTATRAAYSNFVNAPYFNQVSPNDAP